MHDEQKGSGPRARIIGFDGGDRGVGPDLNDIDTEALVRSATEVRERAYVPFSRYKVGAALLTARGRIIQGCNFENSSIGATICAERAAVGTALSAGEREWTALAVVADSDEPVVPCGICRQVLAEFAPHMPVIMENLSGRRRVMTVQQLLPGIFTLPADEVET